MKPASIIAVLGVAAMIGWNAPRQVDLAPVPVSARSGDPAAGKAAWNAGQTVLKRQGDGHFYADASVADGAGGDGQVRFLVDTGASMVALTGGDAQSIGLTWDEADLRRVGSGASGAVYGVPVMLDRVELGGFEARNVQAAIIPDGLDVSLLGQSVLSQVPSVAIDEDEMRIGD